MAAAALFAIAAEAAGAPAAETHRGRVMDIDAVVTDAGGRPVTGLPREAFRVRLDREDVDVDYFAAVRGGVVSRLDLESLSPDLVLSPGREDEATVPRHFLLWIDERGLTPARRRRALAGLRDFLGRLAPSDEAAVVAERARPEALAGWTSRAETLVAALDTLGPADEAGALRRPAARERQALRDVDAASGAERESRARAFEEDAYADAKRKLDGLAESLALFADKDGKKIVVVLAESFDLQPGAAVLAEVAPRGSPPPAPRRDLTADLRRIVERANALEATVFTVDLRGLGIAEDASAAGRPPAARAETDTGLVRLADDTGGEAVLRDDDFPSGLSAILRDVSTYYSLGVDLRNVSPDAPHRIDVAVVRPGLRVRARRTYAPEDESARIEDRVRATLLTSTAYADLAPVVRTGAPAREAPRSTVPVDVELPPGDLAFTAEAGSTVAHVVYYFAARNDRGEETPLLRTTQSFALAPGDVRSSRPLVARFPLKLGRGIWRLVVNVLDETSGKMGTARITVRVEQP